MKTLSAATTAAIDSPYVAPVRLLTIEFTALTLYLCDRVFGDAGSACVFDGNLYEPLIKSWGTIQCGRIDPVTYAVEPSEASFVILNIPVGGADRFTALFSTHDPHYAVVTISEFPEGGSAGDEIDLFKGRIEDFAGMTADQVTVVCSGLELAIANMFAHNIVDATSYPSADPDDLGKMLPQAYGSARKVPFMAVDAGNITTLVEDLDNSETTIDLSASAALPTTGTVQIDLEKITYTGNTSNQLTGCTRGASGTTAVAHDLGAAVAEIQTEYCYIIGHAVKAIDAVYVSNVRQVGNYTAYTGQTGDQHASYGATACIKFTALPMLVKQVNVTLTDTTDVTDAITVTDNIAMTTQPSKTIYSVDADIGSNMLADAGVHAFNKSVANTVSSFTPTVVAASSKNGYSESWKFSVQINSLGTAGEVKITIETFNNVGGLNEVFKIVAGAITVPLNEPYTVYDASPNFPYAVGYFKVTSNAAWDGEISVTLTEVVVNLFEYQETATKAGTASRAGAVTHIGSVTLTGNSVADTVIGGRVACDVQGWQDDGAGTYTGTPDALIERPDHIAKHILIHRCGLTAAEIDAAAYAAAGSFYNTNSYVLALAILQRPNVRALLNRVARQAKSIEFWEAGVHHLVHIPATETTDKTLCAIRIDLGQVWVKYTKRVDIQNTLAASYDRDWSGYNEELESDRAVVMAADSASVTKFGTLQGDALSFPYIPGATQAQAVLDWVKGDLANPRLVPEMAGGYYLADIERGDIIQLALGTDAGVVFVDANGITWEDTAQVGWHKEVIESQLKSALVGLTINADQFRVIDKTYRPDAAQQIEAVKI